MKLFYVLCMLSFCSMVNASQDESLEAAGHVSIASSHDQILNDLIRSLKNKNIEEFKSIFTNAQVNDISKIAERLLAKVFIEFSEQEESFLIFLCQNADTLQLNPQTWEVYCEGAAFIIENYHPQGDVVINLFAANLKRKLRSFSAEGRAKIFKEVATELGEEDASIESFEEVPDTSNAIVDYIKNNKIIATIAVGSILGFIVWKFKSRKNQSQNMLNN